MVNINYNRLFNIRTFHDFYENEKARDIQLQPTGKTRKILHDGNMLFKTLPSGFTVLYRATDDEISPLVSLPADLTLSFVLKAGNKAEFLNITNLNESSSRKYSSSDVLYFSNDPASASTSKESPEEITHELLDGTKSYLFTYSFELENPPDEVLLRVKNADDEFVSPGTAVGGTPLPIPLTVTRKDDNSYSQQIDLRGKPAGKYTISIRNMADDTPNMKEAVFYVDEALASQNILGVVDIKYESATDHLYGDTEEFELQFSRKESIWKYFIVNKNRKYTEGFLINDAGSSGSVNFTREGTEPHDSIRINGLDTVIFKSDNPIPFNEIPKTSIQLEKENTPNNTVIVKNLPNPSLSGVVKDRGSMLESEIYVFI